MELIHPLAHIHRAGGALSQQRCSQRPSLAITRPPARAEQASRGRNAQAVFGSALQANMQGASGEQQLTPHRARLAHKKLVSTQLGLQGEGGRTHEERAAAGK